jgi:hypothetical protein
VELLCTKPREEAAGKFCNKRARVLQFFFFLAAVIQNIEERCRDVERKKELEGFCKIREQGEEKPRENLKKKLCDDLMGAGFVL